MPGSSRDDRIAFVGSSYDGGVDSVVDVPDRIVTPGFNQPPMRTSTSRRSTSPCRRTSGTASFWLTGLIEILPAEMAGLDDEGARACLDYSLIELARTGTTRCCRWVASRSTPRTRSRRAGCGGYVAPMYAVRPVVHAGRPTGRLRLGRGRRPAGLREGDRVRGATARPCGRAAAGLPGTGPRSTPAARPCSATPAMPPTTSTSRCPGTPPQGVWSSKEMTRRLTAHPRGVGSRTSGSSRPRTRAGSRVFISGNSWVHYAGDDLGLLASSGTARSAYNAWCFTIRRGLGMESFPEYGGRGPA
jgi:hypothetical protein